MIRLSGVGYDGAGSNLRFPGPITIGRWQGRAVSSAPVGRYAVTWVAISVYECAVVRPEQGRGDLG